MKDSLKLVTQSSDFVELKNSEHWIIDLKYASTDNFMGENVYQDFNRAFLHRVPAQKLERAAALLKAQHPQLKFIIYDALRPRSVQYVLWDKVKDTPQESYVANPARGSMHNYGFAVDLSLMDASGQLLDMGTDFDEFTPVSQPKLEEQYFQSGQLTHAQLENRKILRRAMEGAGFIQLPHEWWHFDALPRTEVTQQYQIIE